MVYIKGAVALTTKESFIKPKLFLKVVVSGSTKGSKTIRSIVNAATKGTSICSTGISSGFLSRSISSKICGGLCLFLGISPGHMCLCCVGECPHITLGTPIE